MNHPQSLFDHFDLSADRHPDRPAIELGGESWTYAALREQALAIAVSLQQGRNDEGPPLTAILMDRSLAGYAGILGILASGHGYVPMLPGLPTERIVTMLERSGVRTLVVDAAGQRVLEPVLAALDRPLRIIEAEAPTASAADWRRPEVGPEDVAYLLFTSGSTGTPKGVAVAHRNIQHFLEVVESRYGLRETDRFTHLFEITFDLSLFDLFAAWRVGGCVCVPDGRQRLLPVQYVNDLGLTIWFSVPSAALLMKEMRVLAPGAMPGLRHALFCGEALPVSVAEAFATAAPAATLENIYGPTEVTLACTGHRWTEASETQAEHGVVPIGQAFPGLSARVVDEDLHEVAPGETGELLMAGPQVALGYWQDPERTAAAFLVPPGTEERHYRTGDRVRRPKEPGGPLTFLGRADGQIKLRGHRVELGEIEAAIQAAAGLDAAVAIGWPRTDAGPTGIVAFVATAEIDERAVLEQVAQRLPRYMIPRELVRLDAFPLNANGKIDRKALLAQLQAR